MRKNKFNIGKTNKVKTEDKRFDYMLLKLKSFTMTDHLKLLDRLEHIGDENYIGLDISRNNTNEFKELCTKQSQCNCSFRIGILGDGCEICNPELAKELRRS